MLPGNSTSSAIFGFGEHFKEQRSVAGLTEEIFFVVQRCKKAVILYYRQNGPAQLLKWQIRLVPINLTSCGAPVTF